MQIPLVAVQPLQRRRHIAIAAPQHTVAAHDDGTETDRAAVRKLLKLFFACINDGEYLITANPYLTAMLILSLDFYVAQRHPQMTGQVSNGLFFRI